LNKLERYRKAFQIKMKTQKKNRIFHSAHSLLLVLPVTMKDVATQCNRIILTAPLASNAYSYISTLGRVKKKAVPFATCALLLYACCSICKQKKVTHTCYIFQNFLNTKTRFILFCEGNLIPTFRWVRPCVELFDLL
jgi:hypothetical protein